MATNTSNSNLVNIKNLPQSQIATDTDLIILETQNGTQTIEFQNFNVVRTDIAGNATITGSVTGNNAVFSDVVFNTVRAEEIFSGGEQGVSNGYDFYNKFKTTNGVVVSADYVIGSPEYQTLLALYRTLSANSSVAYKRVYEYAGTASIPNGSNSSNVINIGGFPIDASGNSVGSLIGNSTQYAAYFTITPYQNTSSGSIPAQTPCISGFSYNPGTGAGDDFILCSVCQLSANDSGSNYNYGVKLVYFYN